MATIMMAMVMYGDELAMTIMEGDGCADTDADAGPSLFKLAVL